MVELAQVCTKYPKSVQHTYLVDVCDEDKDRYRFGFNGMEKDNELKGVGNSLDFGARMYDSRVARWLSLDPLAAKYPSISPYAFVANSPLIFIDPDGRDLKASFATQNARVIYKQILNVGLEGQFEVDIQPANKASTEFTVKLIAIEGHGDVNKLTKGGKAFYDLLKKVTEDSKVIVLQDVVDDDPNTMIGSFMQNTLDIADIDKLNSGGKDYQPGSVTKQSAVAHEVEEQYLKAKAGLKKGEFAKGATIEDKMESFNNDYHNPAIKVEESVGGYSRVIDTQVEDYIDVYTLPEGGTSQIHTEIKVDGSSPNKSVQVTQPAPKPVEVIK